MQLIVLLLFINHAHASISLSFHQSIMLRNFAKAAERYYDDKGEYPRTDESGTWYEKLVQGEYLPEREPRFGLSPNGSLPLDLYGFPVIYEPPVNSKSDIVILRSVGKNGVDDKGALDDWDIRYGPNFGYWYKTRWPAMYRRAALCGMIALFGSIIALLMVKSRHWALILCLFIIGLCGSVVMRYGFGGGLYPTSIRNAPGWFVGVSQITACMVIVALLMSLEPCVVLIRKRLSRVQFVCKSCGYDLNGLPTTICPECGTDQKTNTGQVP